MNISEALFAALVEVGELFVILAEEPEDGGVNIVDVHGQLNGAHAKIVGGAQGAAAFDACAGHPHGEAVGVMVAAVGALAALFFRRYRLVGLLAIGQVTLIVLGWGLAQRPYLIAPDVTIAGAAAPETTLRMLLWALAAGSVLLFPSLYWLFRVFKRPPSP